MACCCCCNCCTSSLLCKHGVAVMLAVDGSRQCASAGRAGGTPTASVGATMLESLQALQAGWVHHRSRLGSAYYCCSLSPSYLSLSQPVHLAAGPWNHPAASSYRATTYPPHCFRIYSYSWLLTSPALTFSCCCPSCLICTPGYAYGGWFAVSSSAPHPSSSARAWGPALCQAGVGDTVTRCTTATTPLRCPAT